MDNSIILCEGETDQALVGCYLERILNWEYIRGKKNVPFPTESVVWYRDIDGQSLNGIWQVGGNDFRKALQDIVKRETLDHFFGNIVIITDHDDKSAENDRISEISKAIKNTCKENESQVSIAVNEWGTISICNDFGRAEINILYLLVPMEEAGALETFMMNALSEKSPDKDFVISEAKRFISSFQSDTYLTQHRERVKAELGVSLSIFSPDRVFTTMKELIDSVKWEDFATTHKQFEQLIKIK